MTVARGRHPPAPSGAGEVGPDTVPGVMDAPEPRGTDGVEAEDRPSPASRPVSPPRVLGLPRRTLAICVAIAAIGALLAGLVASVVLSDDAPSDEARADLEAVEEADPEAMLAVALTTPDGKPTTLAANLDGRPMVVNLWAHSCAPCIEEMPLLEAAHQEHPSVGFLGVHVNDPAPSDQLEKAKGLATQTGITFPWVQDPDRNFFFEAKAAGMPTTLFLDERGRILATKTGAFSDRAELWSWISEHQPPT